MMPGDKEVSKFHTAVQREAKKKFGTFDMDTDPLVEVMLVDRRTHEGLHYQPIPYWHMAQTEKDKAEILRWARFNLSVAVHKLETVWKLLGD